MQVKHETWKKWIGPALILLIFSAGFVNFYIRPSPARLETKIPKSNLNAFLNLSLVVDALLFNYNGGRFTEANLPTTRAFNDGIGILSIIEESYNIDQDYTLAATQPVQGIGGGALLDLTALDEFSYPGYYVLNVYRLLKRSIGNTLDQAKYIQFLNQCYNGSTGGFSLKPGDPTNVYANWMIIRCLTWLNALVGFDIEKNLEFCKDSLQITNAQNVFSCLASAYITGANLTSNFDRAAIISQCEGSFLTSFDYFDRYYGLMTLDLFGRAPTTYNTTSYLQEVLGEFNNEVQGARNIHNLYAKLSIIALLLGEMKTVGYVV